ncbi:hypothetical protein [Tahibacter soli]|uniref:Uncharacterized protein n=1 Tax=Tahibacter soli TaxID=2983605 RepID=A0A9X4BG62_9GAMM|nr:hypothetical protein [Tahibacter soli]MDC8011096.1 hypothetical protein [Tahibacter soli]
MTTAAEPTPARYIVDDANRSAIQWVLGALLVLAVVLARWIVLARCGSDTPFWDQWDSEIAGLYKPFVEGSLNLAQLFAPHNEHRIAFSRLFNLALFAGNGGQFDNLVETFANAVLYAFVLLVCVGPVLRRLSGPALLLGWLVALAVGIVPYGWENLITGFQNAFYFMNGFAALALALAAFGRGYGAAIASVLLAAASLFTLASGLLLAPVLALVWLARWRHGDAARGTALPAAACAAAIAAVGLALLTPVAGHAALKAQGLADLYGAFLSTTAWPLPPSIVSVALLWWPCAIVLWRVAHRRECRAIDLYLLGIAAWALLQGSAVAWSRGHEMVIASSRYTDTLVLAPLANFALAMRLLAVPASLRRHRAIVAAAAVSALVATTAFAAWGIKGAAALSRHAGVAQENRTVLAAYIAGQGAAAFDGKSARAISYPSRERLALLLDDETTRQLLPSSIRAPLSNRTGGCSGFEYPGVDAATPALAHAVGSYSASVGDGAVGACAGNAVAPRLPYVVIRFAGYLGDPGVTFTLYRNDARGTAMALPPHGAGWTPVAMAAEGPLRWEARDANTASWFAFTLPAEAGSLTARVQSMLPWLRLPWILD